MKKVLVLHMISSHDRLESTELNQYQHCIRRLMTELSICAPQKLPSIKIMGAASKYWNFFW